MKKILTILTILSTLSIAKENEVKFGFSLGGLVKESARYEYKTNSVNPILEDTRLTTENNLGGELAVKYFKVSKLENNFNLKFGFGLSYEFNKTPLLTNGFKHINKSNRDTVELFGDGSSLDKTSFAENENFLEKLKAISDEQEKNPLPQYDIPETIEGVKKHIEIAENKYHHFLTPMVNIELSSQINDDLSIYTGLNIGPRILLNKQYHSFEFDDTANINTYTLDREAKRVDLKVKGIIGLNYKNMYVEAGVSYPRKVDLGIGILFKY